MEAGLGTDRGLGRREGRDRSGIHRYRGDDGLEIDVAPWGGAI